MVSISLGNRTPPSPNTTTTTRPLRPPPLHPPPPAPPSPPRHGTPVGTNVECRRRCSSSFYIYFFFLSSRKETLSPNYAPRTAPVVSLAQRGAGRRVLLSPEKPTAHDQPPPPPPPPPPLPFSLARARLASTPLLLSATRVVTSFSFYILLITLRRACVNRRINYKLYLSTLLLSSSSSRKKNKVSHYNYNVDARTRKTWEQFPLRNIIASCIFFFLPGFLFINVVSHNIVFARPKTRDTADSRRNDDVNVFLRFRRIVHDQRRSSFFRDDTRLSFRSNDILESCAYTHVP